MNQNRVRFMACILPRPVPHVVRGTREQLSTNSPTAKVRGSLGTGIDRELDIYLKRVRANFNIPVALGFGISKPKDIRKLKEKVDITVIGSAIIREVKRSTFDGKIDFIQIKEAVKRLKQA